MRSTKGESIDAHEGGGSSSSSVEGSVMGLERRGWVSSQQVAANPAKAGEELDYLLRRLAAVRLQEDGWHEPYESRGSRTDLRGTGGEIPPVYPALYFNDFSYTDNPDKIYQVWGVEVLDPLPA